MEIKEVKEKSVKGAKWTFILTIISLPLGFITNVILGRISPESLGVYGLINIFIGFVTSFILFGGSNVIMKYLPETKGETRNNFVLSYVIIVFIISLIFMFVLAVYPNILEYITGSDVPSFVTIYLIIFIPIIILYSLSNYILNGLMEIKTASIIGQTILYGNFVVFLILFIFHQEFFIKNMFQIIFGSFFIFYTIFGVLSSFLVIKKINTKNLKKNSLKKRFHIYFPQKFWISALFIHLSTIAFFVSDKLDQILVISFFGIADLGIYYASLQVASLIRLMPLLLGNVLLPTFSNFLVSNDTNSIRKWYSKIIKYNSLILIPTVFFLIFFSKYIMLLFGEMYVNNYFILVILATFFSTGIVSPLNNSVIIARGKVNLYFYGEAFSIIIGILIAFLLINELGLIGLAIYKGLTIGIWQIITSWITKKLGMDLKIHRSYKIGTSMSFLAMILYLVFPIQNIILNFSFVAIFTLIFFYLSKFSKKDMNFLMNNMKKI